MPDGIDMVMNTSVRQLDFRSYYPRVGFRVMAACVALVNEEGVQRDKFFVTVICMEFWCSQKRKNWRPTFSGFY
jgi:hypothetical protein